jgi:hypothetical protein
MATLTGKHDGVAPATCTCGEERQLTPGARLREGDRQKRDLGERAYHRENAAEVGEGGGSVR